MNEVRVIESSITGKYGEPDACEDGIFVNENYIAVIDGVTTKSERRYGGKRGGRVAEELIVRKLAEMPGDLNSVSFLNCLSETIHAFSQDHGCSGNEIPRACILVYSIHNHVIYGYGDCQCRINGKTYSFHKKIDALNETLRSYVIETALKQGSSLEEIRKDDPGRKAILPYLRTQYLFENETGEFGYPVLNGDPVNPDLVTEIPVSEGAEVILASDGYPVLKDTLQESENVLKQLLEKDPLCFRINPQTKGVVDGQISYDDRSYIRFQV